MNILKLVRQIACAICQGTQRPSPTIKIWRQDVDSVRAELPYQHLMTLDSLYHYTTREGWDKVFDYIWDDFDFSTYEAEKFDCDDFAILLKGLVSSYFGLNAFGVMFGNTPFGYHAFNCFRTETGWLLIEPQNGDVFNIGEKGYEPQYVLI